jgi:hypothetical protein
LFKAMTPDFEPGERRLEKNSPDEEIRHAKTGGEDTMKKRLPLILSMTALVVTVLGTTPLGHAARSAVSPVVPLAKTANWAKNAGKLNGHSSSRVPRVGQIPVVGANGKLPAMLGAVGPAGPAGPKGDAGAKGDPGAAGVGGYQRVQQQVNAPGGENGERTYTVPCPGGKSVLGGGFNFSKGADTDNVTVIESSASSDSVWEFKLRNKTGQRTQTVTLSAVCATVSS